MLDKNKHKIISKNILKDIYSDRLLAPILGFKGGTACYLFYGLPRFSTDLDFNLLDLKKKEEVFERIKNILLKYGKVVKSDKKYYTLFFLLRYEKNKQAIKVEISLRGSDDNYEIKNLLGVSVLVMTKKDMFAHKLVAATERKSTANRDLFDINFFLEQMWDINESIIKKRTGNTLKEYFEKLIKFVEKKVNEKNILDGLGEILDKNQKDKVRAILKRDLLFNLKNRLEIIKTEN